MITVEVSFGELCDKRSILQVKSLKITNSEKLKDVNYELELVSKTFETTLTTIIDTAHEKLLDTYSKLYAVNLELWDIENGIRQCELEQDFGATFIDLSRSIYFKNDYRAALKSELNSIANSPFSEAKQHPKYSEEYNL
jgi:hypothetical protein